MTQRFVTALLLSLTILMPVQANQVEDAFLEVKQSFIHRDKNAQNELKQYIRDYPYTTYMSETQMMSRTDANTANTMAKRRRLAFTMSSNVLL